QSMDVTARRLWSAIREGLIIPLEDSQDGRGPRYQFAHDRVLQVAYSLVSGADKEALHLRIGRRLSQGLTDRELDLHLFDAVEQMKVGARLVTADSERLQLAQLNSRAA